MFKQQAMPSFKKYVKYFLLSSQSNCSYFSGANGDK